MPHVRISLLTGKSNAYLQTLSDAVQDALVASLDISPSDRFQVIEQLSAGQFIVSNPLVGVEHAAETILIHISLKAGRTVEMKKALYQALATRLNSALGISTNDVIIILNDVAAENWSFGQGLATLIA